MTLPLEDNFVRDANYYRYVGYQEDNFCIKKLFSQQNINMISRKVSDLLQGVHWTGRPIIVPDTTIAGILSEVYDSYRPETGDIFGRYNVPGSHPENYVLDIVNQTIQIITEDVKTNLGMEENNKKLSVWTTVLGDFNEHNLRAHPVLKIRKRNTNFRGQVSFMNY